MSAITTHVLDTARGRPASGVPIRLDRHGDDGWTRLGEGETDGDGRLATLLADGVRPEPGTYRLVFDTGGWCARQAVECFYPWVEIVFRIRDGAEHHHVPLLLSPFGYSTYRGS